MTNKRIMEIFKEYEDKFGEWLYTAWNFDSVDWQGLAAEAEKCIKQNTPMKDKVKQSYLEHFDSDKVY